MISSSDDFDRAIAYLKERPGEIYTAWINWQYHVAGCLFAPLGEQGKHGCPTQVYNGTSVSAFPELTEAIINESDFPSRPGEIEFRDLSRFAKWQRLYRNLKKVNTNG